LLTDGRTFLDDPKQKPQIEENWRFIFQEPLPSEQPAKKSNEDPNGKLLPKGRPKQSRRKKRDED